MLAIVAFLTKKLDLSARMLQLSVEVYFSKYQLKLCNIPRETEFFWAQL